MFCYLYSRLCSRNAVTCFPEYINFVFSIGNVRVLSSHIFNHSLGYLFYIVHCLIAISCFIFTFYIFINSHIIFQRYHSVSVNRIMKTYSHNNCFLQVAKSYSVFPSLIVVGKILFHTFPQNTSNLSKLIISSFLHFLST